MSDRKNDELIDEILSQVVGSVKPEPPAEIEEDETVVYLPKKPLPVPPSSGEDTAEFSRVDANAPVRILDEDEDEDADMKVVADATVRPASADELEQTREMPKLSVVQAATRTFDTLDEDIPADKPQTAAEKKAAKKAAEQQMEGQISFTELVEEEPIVIDTKEDEPEEPEQPISWEERLQKVREEKIKNFKLDGEEEVNDPDEELTDEEEDPIDDEPEEDVDEFVKAEDAPAIASELSYRRRTGFISLAVTAVLEIVLLCLSAVLHVSRSINVDVTVFVGLHLLLLGVMMALNLRIITHGIAALFRREPDADTALALAPVVVLLQTVALLFNPKFVAATPMALMPSVAGMLLVFGAYGRWSRTCRMQENFRFMAARGDKLAAHMISDSEVARTIGRSALAIADPEVLYFRKTGFLSRFLYHSCDEPTLPWNYRWMSVMGTGISLVSAVVYWWISQSATWLNALTVFASLMCLVTPTAALLIDNLPLRRAAKRALRHGGMIASWSAVEEFGQPNAMMVDAHDLFPDDSVVLHGIKTFSGTRIDAAILDAASVTIQAGGPLAGVFMRVIEHKTDILQEVDTLVYEQEMGLSGWVDGRRVLVGNRRLLENHGVDVPSLDYESRYTLGGRKLLYLSVSGELSAMFVISYIADPAIRTALQDLSSVGVTVLVHTCDPNITEQVVRETFDLEPYCVEVMTAAPARTAEQLVDGCDEEQEAILASNGQVAGMAVAVTACTRLGKVSRLGWLLQFIAVCIGLVLGAITVIGSGATVAPVYAWIFLAVSGLVVSIVQRCLKV